MKLFLISQDVNNNYDTYDSAVVCAKDEKEAVTLHPSGREKWDGKFEAYGSWCAMEDVKVEYIGEAVEGLGIGVVCASFNPG